MTLDSLGEDAVIQRLLAQLPDASGVLVGPGDDCAVIETASPDVRGLLKTDCIVEGVHFLPETDAAAVGWKALARNVSDFAAMGAADPQHALVTLVAPGDREVAWAEALYEGIGRCAAEFGISVAGGETSKSPAVCLISISLMGEIPADKVVLRSGAKEGDAILVTGTLGGSLSGRHLSFEPRLKEARWLASHYLPSAMMDLSDGLAKDLPRLAKASAAGYQVDLELVPCTEGCGPQEALGDGEDYELLFTLAEEKAEALLRDWKAAFPNLPLTRIGRMVPPAETVPLTGGWDHF